VAEPDAVAALHVQDWVAAVPLPPALQGAFQLPPAFEDSATFTWAVSGALVAARRGYNVSGITALALGTATGGGLRPCRTPGAPRA
jgi:Glycine transporter